MRLDAAKLSNFPYARRFEEGAVIAKRGAADGCMYILLSGEANLGERVLKTGDFFGASCLFLGAARRFTAVSRGVSVVLEVRRDNAAQFFAEQPQAAVELCAELCRRAVPAGVAATAAPPPKPEPVPVAASGNAPPSAPDPGAPSMSHPLLPVGHKTYAPMPIYDTEYVYEKDVTCPVCGRVFKHLTVKGFKLVSAGMDPDMRQRFKGVEPMYYSVITCQHCLYSAPDDNFPQGAKTKRFQQANIAEMKSVVGIKFGKERGVNDVFLSYFLGLQCAPLCFTRGQMITASLLLKLSRLYGDCGDEEMCQVFKRKAYEAYLTAYETVEVTPMQEPPLNNIIAELAYQLGDFRRSRSFFFKNKSNKNCPPIYRDHADDRIYEMKGEETAE